MGRKVRTKTVENQVQVSIRVLKPRNVQLTHQLLMQFLHYRAYRGVDPPGVEIRMIEWSKSGKTYVYEGNKLTDALGVVLRVFPDIQFSVERG